MKRPPKSSLPKRQHLYEVTLPTYHLWAEDEEHALEQYLNILGLQTGALSLNMIDAIIEEVE